jgi:hypothetical protein
VRRGGEEERWACEDGAADEEPAAVGRDEQRRENPSMSPGDFRSIQQASLHPSRRCPLLLASLGFSPWMRGCSWGRRNPSVAGDADPPPPFLAMASNRSRWRHLRRRSRRPKGTKSSSRCPLSLPYGSPSCRLLRWAPSSPTPAVAS